MREEGLLPTLMSLAACKMIQRVAYGCAKSRVESESLIVAMIRSLFGDARDNIPK